MTHRARATHQRREKMHAFPRTMEPRKSSFIQRLIILMVSTLLAISLGGTIIRFIPQIGHHVVMKSSSVGYGHRLSPDRAAGVQKNGKRTKQEPKTV